MVVTFSRPPLPDVTLAFTRAAAQALAGNLLSADVSARVTALAEADPNYTVATSRFNEVSATVHCPVNEENIWDYAERSHVSEVDLAWAEDNFLVMSVRLPGTSTVELVLPAVAVPGLIGDLAHYFA